MNLHILFGHPPFVYAKDWIYILVLVSRSLVVVAFGLFQFQVTGGVYVVLDVSFPVL